MQYDIYRVLNAGGRQLGEYSPILYSAHVCGVNMLLEYVYITALEIAKRELPLLYNNLSNYRVSAFR